MVSYSSMLTTISQAVINWHEVINLNAVPLAYISWESALTVLIRLMLCVAGHTRHFRKVSCLSFDQNVDKKVEGIPHAPWPALRSHCYYDVPEGRLDSK